MKPKDYVAKLRKQLSELESAESKFYTLVTNLVREQRKRIFDKGEGYDGAPFGTYTNNKYLELKQKKGRLTTGNRVNLFLTNNFQRAFVNSVNPAKTSGGVIEIKTTIRSDATNPASKLEFIFTEYPNAFKLSDDERKMVVNEALNIVKKTFGKS